MTLKDRSALKKEQKKKKAEAAAKQKADKQAAKQLKKAQLEQMKKDKENLFILRKNTSLRIGRFLIWTMMTFIFIRGVVTCIQPDPRTEVNRAIQDFKAELDSFQSLDSELLAFAENFAVRYFSYQSGGEAEYSDSLKAFAAPQVSNIGIDIPNGAACRVLYANAYRKEQLSENQYDVWVMLELEYTTERRLDEGGYATQTTTEQTIIRIPVMEKNGRYIVEDLPAFANDDSTIKKYSPESFNGGSECNDTIRKSVRQALTNFFIAYCRDEQGVINYYLSPKANQADFIGLNGRVQFTKIDSLSVYPIPNETDRFIALVNLSMRDKNGMTLPQSYHIELLYRDDQFYIETMNLRTHNIQ
ncbi:MAG: conjugal transfer protein [Oscillospiraceae bacterium]|nr:conjugal transfer protein [Oscillospiraceae bacterium]MBP1557254.1 conjugal transfer protein [Oscillospiraceae bacterium]